MGMRRSNSTLGFGLGSGEAFALVLGLGLGFGSGFACTFACTFFVWFGPGLDLDLGPWCPPCRSDPDLVQDRQEFL